MAWRGCGNLCARPNHLGHRAVPPDADTINRSRRDYSRLLVHQLNELC